MFSIAIGEVLAKLPIAQLGETLREFVQPFVEGLSDVRLQRVVPQAVRGIRHIGQPDASCHKHGSKHLPPGGGRVADS